MLDLDDPRWSTFTSGRQEALDASSLLRQLELDSSDVATWRVVWDALYHQGSIGTASLAAVPHLVRIHHGSSVFEWNTYALVASIEISRVMTEMSLPEAIDGSYRGALIDLAELGLAELRRTNDPMAIRSILGMLALERGAQKYARMLVELSEDEVDELLSGGPQDP